MSFYVSDRGYEIEVDNEVDFCFVDDMDVYLVESELGLSGEVIMSESRFMNYYYKNEFKRIDVENLVDEGQY